MIFDSILKQIRDRKCSENVFVWNDPGIRKTNYIVSGDIKSLLS